MELAQQSIGNRSCVKVQGASLSGEECPTISWEEFQVRKSVLSVDSFTGVTTCTPETNFILFSYFKIDYTAQCDVFIDMWVNKRRNLYITMIYLSSNVCHQNSNKNY